MWIKRKRNPQSVQNLEISPFLLKQYRLKCGKNMPKNGFFFNFYGYTASQCDIY